MSEGRAVISKAFRNGTLSDLIVRKIFIIIYFPRESLFRLASMHKGENASE